MFLTSNENQSITINDSYVTEVSIKSVLGAVCHINGSLHEAENDYETVSESCFSSGRLHSLKNVNQTFDMCVCTYLCGK